MEYDATFYALVGLILFFVLLGYLGVHKMLGKALDGRASAIAKELDEAKRLREEAGAVLAEYKKKARDAEVEAQTIVDQARREAAALADEAKTRMEDYVTRRTKMAEDKIAQAEHQAIQEVKALSADISIAAAEKILSARLKGQAGSDLVASSIADVKNRLN
ncbi:F0F1 ATP synthase subunit B [Kaistia dalseonensis]|uniref:ATP synthase subunit b n=1 Tax=Kaistia dalseonensis TaxID=410840 RepID=A0ABU0HEF7_9HYPH|nr:F0F1 ATP synthase subunit B [Kaistia dalseonensis]MCX5497486.1 F0F1 ATP synthase subunit B [Kaistia dalseonensis]MDQ0440125.1 F-type H+-transporting ATPase subunit b [Kaistia dalseonensis]